MKWGKKKQNHKHKYSSPFGQQARKPVEHPANQDDEDDGQHRLAGSTRDSTLHQATRLARRHDRLQHTSPLAHSNAHQGGDGRYKTERTVGANTLIVARHRAPSQPASTSLAPSLRSVGLSQFQVRIGFWGGSVWVSTASVFWGDNVYVATGHKPKVKLTSVLTRTVCCILLASES